MRRLELLDYGRFSAAIFVVLFHYTFNGILNGKISSISYVPAIIEFTKYGYLGVDLFFMISGYVIFISARNRSASKFAVSRAKRLYPAYWFAVLFTTIFALQWGGDLMSVYPTEIIANFSMLQSFIGIDNVDGVYWTLAYEITFYTGVFLLLLFGLQKKLNYFFTYWPLLFLTALLFGKQSYPFLGSYYYYFCAGALFAVLKEKFDRLTTFSLLISYLLCLFYSAGKAAQLTEERGVEYSVLIIILIVSIFFAFFAYLNTKKAQLLSLPMSRMVGAMTYPVYLIHAHFGYMFISRFANEKNKIGIYILTISLVIAVAYLIHRVIEVNFSNFWNKFFDLSLGRLVDYLQDSLSRFKLVYNNRIN